MLPAIGQKFGPYEILALLGRGGMGVVYRAWDERLYREVAIKVLQDEYQAAGMRERFLLEARAASALAHPHICTVFDLGEQDGEPYMVMELLEGSTLKQVIGQRACSAEEIVRYGVQVAEALSAAHAKGVVHRDIKPANVFLQSQPGGRSAVKILDFGLAKVSMALRSGRDSRALELTSAGFTVGTLAYMSPEQARGEALDARTDLFSLGALLYEMATRRAPFGGATVGLAFQALLGAPPDPIRKWNVTVPRELERVIMRLLQKERNQRFADATGVREELLKLIARSGGEWLRRLPVAVVPLVATSDPVARYPRAPVSRSRQKAVATSEERTAAALPPERDSTEQIDPATVTLEPEVKDEAVLRPWRLPQRSDQVGSPHLGSRTARERDGLREDAERVPQAAREILLLAGAVVPATDELERARLPIMADPSFRRPQHKRSSQNLPVATAVAVAAIVTDETGQTAAIASDENGRAGPAGLKRRWMLVLVLVLAAVGAVAGTVVVALRSGGLGLVVLGPTESVLLGPIQNRTGDDTLDGVVLEVLRLSLAERSHLRWLGVDALAAGTRLVSTEQHRAVADVQAQSVAQRLGARAYIAGEVTGRRGHESLRLDIIDSSTNDRLGSVSETVMGTSDLLGAVTRLADALRAKLGETSQAAREANGGTLTLPANGDALAMRAFAAGEAAQASGDRAAAQAHYREAVALAPQFGLAHLRLAWSYEEDGAELAAAESAGRAFAASAGETSRVQLMSRTTAQLLQDGDAAAALVTIRGGVSRAPDDAEFLTLLARVMRANGRMTEALLAAEKALGHDAYSADAYREAALARLGQERAAEALLVGRRATQHGVTCGCGQLIARMLLAADAFVPPGVAAVGLESFAMMESLSDAEERALLLDDAGHFSGGLFAWRRAAGIAQARPQLTSAAAGMLATAALDRALAGRCSETAALAQDASLLAYGRQAASALALSRALCSSADSGTARGPETGGGLAIGDAESGPLLQTAQAVGARRAGDALAAASRLPADNNAPPLLWYVRGVALALSGERGAASEALEHAARHHGYALLTRSIVAPLAAARLRSLETQAAARVR